MASEGSQEVKRKMVTLKSKDGMKFYVQRKVAEQSQMLKNFIEYEDDNTDVTPPIPVKVTSNVLESVISYCEKHSEEPPSGNEGELTKHRDNLIQWDSRYMNKVKKNIELLYNLFTAAKYLEIQGLLDLTIQTLADMIRKSQEETDRILGITNDLTPEEEHEIRQQEDEISEQNLGCGNFCRR